MTARLTRPRPLHMLEPISEVCSDDGSAMVRKRGRGRPPLTPEQLAGKPPRRSKRVEALLEDDEVFVNIKLTEDEARALKRVSMIRGAEMRRTIYPVVLVYLRDRAHPVDRLTVLRLEELQKDRYWGTEREITEPRELPEGAERFTGKRPKFTQQIMQRRGRQHLRAIQKYYNCEAGDLVRPALAYAEETAKANES